MAKVQWCFFFFWKLYKKLLTLLQKSLVLYKSKGTAVVRGTGGASSAYGTPVRLRLWYCERTAHYIMHTLFWQCLTSKNWLGRDHLCACAIPRSGRKNASRESKGKQKIKRRERGVGEKYKAPPPQPPPSQFFEVRHCQNNVCII